MTTKTERNILVLDQYMMEAINEYKAAKEAWTNAKISEAGYNEIEREWRLAMWSLADRVLRSVEDDRPF
jgi:hypothetical protein